MIHCTLNWLVTNKNHLYWLNFLIKYNQTNWTDPESFFFFPLNVLYIPDLCYLLNLYYMQILCCLRNSGKLRDAPEVKKEGEQAV